MCLYFQFEGFGSVWDPQKSFYVTAELFQGKKYLVAQINYVILHRWKKAFWEVFFSSLILSLIYITRKWFTKNTKFRAKLRWNLVYLLMRTLKISRTVLRIFITAIKTFRSSWYLQIRWVPSPYLKITRWIENGEDFIFFSFLYPFFAQKKAFQHVHAIPKCSNKSWLNSIPWNHPAGLSSQICFSLISNSWSEQLIPPF